MARKHGLNKVRVSGCEPLINKEHLLSVIRMAISEGFNYVLDTNGLLLDDNFLASLEPFRNRIYIYMGLKGSNAELFESITKAQGRFWYRQLEALRLVVKHKMTLGVNVIANFTPANTMPTLFNELYKISPVLPLTVDMKQCTFFVHNARRIKEYGTQTFRPTIVKRQWNAMLDKWYGDASDLLDMYNFGETNKAFDRYELSSLQEQVEWANGLKFVHLPEVPFNIPFSSAAVRPS